ncbi:hypothetical protein COCMIDRAFT_90312 [Bipolaris oryzae ATCC 44560]|uniref:Peptidase A1 domain-containing protein n=1 Tax=Bipolaris oryzae ATCC 44560 TaxID=930090 RepID=W6ZBN7_COCMI|nr:uncharacterized protein COCMIDRAFT_90312 [Bipolaris oryzae ATCC 44560]EUC47390.1 hypothetical protein COCMIDRAFT_90312 [Bipolaris oryzae ATCC 44560]
MPHSSTVTGKLALAMLASSACALVAEPRGAAYSVDAVAAAPPSFDFEAEFRRIRSRHPAVENVDKRQAHVAGQQQGSVTVVPNDPGVTYLTPTIIGNQTFNLIYDTGSADLWVFGNETSNIQGPGKTYYFPSSSAQLLPNYNWTITYSGGSSANGVVYTDVVKAGPVVAEKQAVEVATYVPSDIDSDGIMGLSFGIINQVKPVQQATFFETVAPTLKKKVFAANLRPEGNGSWDFGYLDKSKYNGDITYTPVVGNMKHWTIAVGEYGAGNKTFGTATIGNTTVDSGSPLIYLPDQVVADYYSQVPDYELTLGGDNAFPCNATLPDFTFKIEDQTFSVPGQYLNFGVSDPSRMRCSGVIVGKRTLRNSLFGSIWMKNFYVVHSMEESIPKLGLAPQA